MNETRQLAEWVVNTGYDDLPDAVREATRIYILDDLAAGFAGARLSWTGMVSDLVFGSNTGSSSVFGAGKTTSTSGAALVNGVAISGFEVDHSLNPASCHPSGSVFPAVLAVAESNHVDGKAFIAAVATGYEAVCRVGLAATRAVEDERGFHGPGTNAPIGGAFGAGKALGLPAGELANAIGIAVSHSAGLLEFSREGAMTKRLHVGRGSQMGLESAILAHSGITGPSTALEGDWGFLNVYSPDPHPHELLKDLGQRYRLMEITLKAFPCHGSFQALIEALLRFKSEHPGRPESIESVEIVSRNRIMEERFCTRSVSTLMGAQYSMPWSVALTLHRDTADPAVWSEDSLRNEQVNALAAAIALREEQPSQASALAEIILTLDGQRHTIVATDWKGAPSNPATFEDVARKFERYSRDVLTGSQTQELIERVRGLEAEADVAQLASMIRG
jgi:2-methylcitrate dehydratase PrpD